MTDSSSCKGAAGEGVAARLAAGDFDAYFWPQGAEGWRTDGQRAFFALLAEVVRAEHDPAVDWDAFCDHLWAWVDAAFGITPDAGGWPEEMPQPPLLDRPAGPPRES